MKGLIIFFSFRKFTAIPSLPMYPLQAALVHQKVGTSCWESLVLFVTRFEMLLYKQTCPDLTLQAHIAQHHLICIYTTSIIPFHLHQHKLFCLQLYTDTNNINVSSPKVWAAITVAFVIPPWPIQVCVMVILLRYVWMVLWLQCKLHMHIRARTVCVNMYAAYLPPWDMIRCAREECHWKGHSTETRIHAIISIATCN